MLRKRILNRLKGPGQISLSVNHAREAEAGLLAKSYAALRIPPEHIGVWPRCPPALQESVSQNPFHGEGLTDIRLTRRIERSFSGGRRSECAPPSPHRCDRPVRGDDHPVAVLPTDGVDAAEARQHVTGLDLDHAAGAALQQRNPAVDVAYGPARHDRSGRQRG